MTKIILHIATDEKFVDNAFKQFDNLNYENNFIILLDRGIKRPKFVKNIDKINTYNVSLYSFKKLKNEIKNSDLVVLYGLNFFTSRLVLKTNSKYLWLFLGGEIYNNKFGLYNDIIGDKTKDLVLSKNMLSFQKNILKPLVRWIYYGYSSHGRTIIKAAKKIKHVGVPFGEEFSLLKQNSFLCNEAHPFEFFFYPIELIIKNYKNVKIEGDNVIIGNSSSNTNNHLEVFEAVSKFDLSNRKLYVPLSYGDKEYAELIKKNGIQKFGDNFISLDTFLTLDEYNKILQSCGIVIMNHYRQQAFGNIIVSLWMGAKVFLSERNNIFKYFKRIGVHIFSIENELNKLNFTNKLSELEIEHNRTILFSLLNENKIKTNLEKQLNEILNEN